MWARREIGVAVPCLVIGSAGQLAQYLVSPVDSGGAAADNVAAASAHPTAMGWAAWLDLCLLFFLPALAVVAGLARARTTRLGWVAAIVAIGTTLPGTAYLLATDVLYVGAAVGSVPTAAIEAYTGSSVVVVATLVFLVGHVLGLVLLGAALWRAGSVPRWAAICLALSPVAELGGSAAGVRPVVIASYLLLTAAFAACAVEVARRPQVPTAAAPVAVGS